MATISITIPNNKLNIILDSYAETYGYQPIINGQPNPESKADFAKSILIQSIKDVVRSYKIRTDSNAIIINANSELDNLDIT